MQFLKNKLSSGPIDFIFQFKSTSYLVENSPGFWRSETCRDLEFVTETLSSLCPLQTLFWGLGRSCVRICKSRFHSKPNPPSNAQIPRITLGIVLPLG